MAVVARALIDIPWPAAIALGAIVAPRTPLRHRSPAALATASSDVTILEGSRHQLLEQVKITAIIERFVGTLGRRLLISVHRCHGSTIAVSLALRFCIAPAALHEQNCCPSWH